MQQRGLPIAAAVPIGSALPSLAPRSYSNGKTPMATMPGGGFQWSPLIPNSAAPAAAVGKETDDAAFLIEGID